MKPAKPAPYQVVVAYPWPVADSKPEDILGMSWAPIDRGQAITLDGALLRARQHLAAFPAAVCLVTRGPNRLFFLKRGAKWDLTTTPARWAA